MYCAKACCQLKENGRNLSRNFNIPYRGNFGELLDKLWRICGSRGLKILISHGVYCRFRNLYIPARELRKAASVTSSSFTFSVDSMILS